MKYLLSITLLVFGFSASQAQYAEYLATSRPGKSSGARVVGTGIFQVQSNVAYGWLDDLPASNTLSWNNQFRFGLSESVEVRWVLGIRKARNSEIPEQLGVHVNEFSIRSKLRKGEGWSPHLAMQAQIKSTWVSDDFKGSAWTPRLVFMAGQRSGPYRLITNIGASWPADGKAPLGWSSFRFGYSPVPIVELHAEYFGEFGKSVFKAGLTAGAGFRIGKNLRLDGSWITYFADQRRNEIDIGIVVRTPFWGPHRPVN